MKPFSFQFAGVETLPISWASFGRPLGDDFCAISATVIGVVVGWCALPM